jgi:branched-chain amino acid transport system substrate-binding protein
MKNHILKKIMVGFLALVTLLGAAGCGQAQQGEAVIKIGALCSLSKETIAGEAYRNAYELAIKEINESGGVLGGMMLELHAQDASTDTDTAINATNKLLFDIDVDVVVGPAFSTQGLAIESLCGEDATPIILTGTSPKISEVENDYLFRGRSSDSIMGALAMKFAMEEFELEEGSTVGVLYNNNDFGTGGFGVIQEFAAAEGIAVVGEAYNVDDADVTAQVVALKSADCDVIIVWSSGGAVPVAARALYEAGVDVPVVGSAASGQNSVLQTASQWIEGWYCVSDCVLTKEDAAIQKFVGDYTAAYGADVLTYESAVAYSMIYLIADAYERAGSAEPEAFLQALKSTGDTKTLIGTYHNYDGIEMFSGGAIGQINGGRVEYISDVDTMIA